MMVEQVSSAKESADDKTNVDDVSDDNEHRLDHLLQKLLAAPQVTCAILANVNSCFYTIWYLGHL